MSELTADYSRAEPTEDDLAQWEAVWDIAAEQAAKQLHGRKDTDPLTDEQLFAIGNFLLASEELVIYERSLCRSIGGVVDALDEGAQNYSFSSSMHDLGQRFYIRDLPWKPEPLRAKNRLTLRPSMTAVLVTKELASSFGYVISRPGSVKGVNRRIFMKKMLEHQPDHKGE